VASIHERYGPRGVQVIGVHTPEFDQERERALVEANVRTLGVRYPVVLDNDSAIWDALDNRFWPTLYLIDARGRIRLVHEGEIHAGEPDAKAIEARIDALVAEASQAASAAPAVHESSVDPAGRTPLLR
jgi:hypothetical protein